MEAAQSTDLREPSTEAAHHSNGWMIIGLVVLAAVPAIALPLTNRKVAAPPRPRSRALAPLPVSVRRPEILSSGSVNGLRTPLPCSSENPSSRSCVQLKIPWLRVRPGAS